MSDELTVVVGLGKTGLSCVRHLIGLGYRVAVIDSRAIPPSIAELRKAFPQVPVYLDNLHEDILNNATQIVISPGVSVREKAIAKQIARGIQPIGDIELFAQSAKAPILAITGTNGKSTVTALVGEMAKQAGKRVAVGGNLGMPALDLLSDEVELYVLELSSFQLETTYSLQTAAAAVLNISPDHLNRYDHYEEYIAAKNSIYHQCCAPIINRDDPLVVSEHAQHAVSFGMGEPKANAFGLRHTQQGWFLAFAEKNLLDVRQLKIKGLHNYVNALAALALGHAIGLPMDAMLQALTTFVGLAHRCQWVAKINNVDWYNDSKATNVGSTLAALEGLGAHLQGKIVLLAGGLAKEADFTCLQDSVRRYVRELILFGQDKNKLKNALQDCTAVTDVSHLADAVAQAKRIAKPGDMVLLSPACASFDMFRDFEHRGEEFCNLVKNLYQHATIVT